MQTDQLSPKTAYSIKQISAATFLGSPLAGCWLLALNYRKFGRPRAAMFSVIAGILISLALIPVSLVLPQWLPRIVPPILYAFGMQLIAERLQDTLLGDHREAGGQVASWWKVIGICLVSIAVFFALIFLVLWVLPQRFGGLRGV